MEPKQAALAAYQRVAEGIKTEIRSGKLAAGEKLPGNRSVAEQYDVSLGTAQKALGLLESEGWLVATPAVGVFVAEEQPATADDLADRVNRLLDAFEGFDQRLSALESAVYQQKQSAPAPQDVDSDR